MKTDRRITKLRLSCPYKRTTSGLKGIKSLCTHHHHTLTLIMVCMKYERSLYNWVPFFFFPLFLFRHKCAAIHPTDGDEDEQERSANAGKQQRGSGLICNPFLCSFGHPLYKSYPSFPSTPLALWTTRTPVLCPLVKMDCFLAWKPLRLLLPLWILYVPLKTKPPRCFQFPRYWLTKNIWK